MVTTSEKEAFTIINNKKKNNGGKRDLDAVKRSSSQDHLNTKTSPKTPSGLKKMFANLFRSGKDTITNGANDKEKGAAEGQNGSSIYDTM